MDMNLAKKIASLTVEKRKLDEALRAVKDQIAELEPSMLNHMMEDQMDRLHLTIDGEKVTLYIHKMMYAKPREGDRATVVYTLKRCGMSDFVTENYNSNSLSAYVRERLASGSPLQPTLSGVIEISEQVSIRGRRSTSSPESSTAKAMKTIRK